MADNFKLDHHHQSADDSKEDVHSKNLRDEYFQSVDHHTSKQGHQNSDNLGGGTLTPGGNKWSDVINGSRTELFSKYPVDQCGWYHEADPRMFVVVCDDRSAEVRVTSAGTPRRIAH